MHSNHRGYKYIFLCSCGREKSWRDKTGCRHWCWYVLGWCLCCVIGDRRGWSWVAFDHEPRVISSDSGIDHCRQLNKINIVRINQRACVIHFIPIINQSFFDASQSVFFGKFYFFYEYR